MQFKQDRIVNMPITSFKNCIPASGEGSRKYWPQDQSKRTAIISTLKKNNIHWKLKSSSIREAWQKKVRLDDEARFNDIATIVQSRAEICMYSKSELKWIQKIHRGLKARLQK